MTLTTTKVYIGHCDNGHPEREVSLVVDDGHRNNDSSARMVRCWKCNQIVKCDPDPSRVETVIGE